MADVVLTRRMSASSLQSCTAASGFKTRDDMAREVPELQLNPALLAHASLTKGQNVTHLTAYADCCRRSHHPNDRSDEGLAASSMRYDSPLTEKHSSPDEQVLIHRCHITDQMCNAHLTAVSHLQLGQIGQGSCDLVSHAIA